MGYVTWPRPFQGHFVIRRLGLAMFNPRIKFEMSTITCSEEMTGNDGRTGPGSRETYRLERFRGGRWWETLAAEAI